MSFIDSIINRYLGPEINRRVDLAAERLAGFSEIRALDDTRDIAILGQRSQRDRYEYDRSEIEEDALEAWRDNPLARRIVSLTSQYVVGGGIGVEADNDATHNFIQNGGTIVKTR
jgi:hypothetical protein